MEPPLFGASRGATDSGDILVVRSAPVEATRLVRGPEITGMLSIPPYPTQWITNVQLSFVLSDLHKLFYVPSYTVFRNFGGNALSL